MFCPNCGKGEQSPNSYCRSCGEFLPDLSKAKLPSFFGNTPEEQIKTTLYLNLASALVSLVLAISLYVSFDITDAPRVIFLTAAFLLAISGWQVSTFAIGLKLRKNFSSQRENAAEIQTQNQAQFEPAKTKELLNEANLENIVPNSITENTTRRLKIKR